MLRGRAAQQARIDALLSQAREGASGALVIHGEPGIGKTALLRYAADRADGMRVLRGSGIESEAELPFAGLHLLLKPALDRIGALPGPQRRALSAAFGLGEGDAGDPFLVGMGVLSLLAELAETQPLLCLVDDIQWLDRPSASALLFAARRLDREGIVMVFAARDDPSAVPTLGIPDLPLRGLDPESAAALLDDRGVSLTTGLRDRLIAETQGNPLALLELPAVLSASTAQHGDTLRPGPMPLTSRVLDAFGHQLRSLPGPTLTLLLVAAAEDTGELGVVLRAGAELGASVAALQPAEARGLVSLAGGTLQFRHPLIRAAAYHAAPLSQRIAAHRALAAAYDGLDDADRRTWHLAAATTAPDEGVAAELELAAGRAAGRSGYAAAAAAYERAARLSEDAAVAAQRLTLAAEAALNSGDAPTAHALAERALQAITDPGPQARLIQVRYGLGFGDEDLREAHATLTTGAAAVASTDPERAFWMVMEAMFIAWWLPLDEQLLAATVKQFDLVGLAPDDPLMVLVWLVHWCTAMTLDHDTSQLLPLDKVMARVPAASATAGPRGMIAAAGLALVSGHDTEAARIAATLVADARARGMLVALPGGLSLQALAEAAAGQYRTALISATEALRLAGDLGQPYWTNWARMALAYVAAVEDDQERCREYADYLPLVREGMVGLTWGQAALALLELGRGQAQAAFDRLEATASGPWRYQSPIFRSAPDQIEAAVRLGQAERAAAPLARFTRWAALVRQPWVDALLARCQALTAADSEAEPHYTRALTLHHPHNRPFERARTELVYGEWLRRSRRKTEARVHLRAALETFESLGSRSWALRARTELNASGAAAPRLSIPDVFATLTPQELQITQLAAQGMSNRDIAAQLFLSPRTVAYHLYKAYPKLGISSRSELTTLTAEHRVG